MSTPRRNPLTPVPGPLSSPFSRPAPPLGTPARPVTVTPSVSQLEPSAAASAPVRPDADWVTVTGEMAAGWLEGMGRNRSVRKARVVEFSRDMLAGSWHPTGEAIKFNEAGSMVDGQHRCEAVVLAAKTDPDIAVSMLVVRGVPQEATLVMDTNTRRSSADQLKIAGYENYAQLAAAAKWCVVWDRKTLYSDKMLKSVTHAEILAYVQDNPVLLEKCKFMMNRLKVHIDMPAGYIGAGYYILWRIDPDEADEFFARLADGVMLPRFHPILALRDRLRDLKADRSSLPGDLYLSLLFRTWNSVRLGKSVHKLQVYKNKISIKCPDPI